MRAGFLLATKKARKLKKKKKERKKESQKTTAQYLQSAERE